MFRVGLIVASLVLLASCSGEEVAPARNSGGASAEEEAKARMEAMLKEPPAKSEMSTPDIEAVWAEGCFSAFMDLVVGSEDEKDYSLPFMSIYGAALTPVHHSSGFRVSNEPGWSQVPEWRALVTEGSRVPGVPSLAKISPYVLVDGAPLDPATLHGAGITFIKYSADWCVPCKLQSVQIQEYRKAYPGEQVMHVEIVSDFMALRGLDEASRPECAVEAPA
ncbi:MAG: TlpA family protein disulfide reductase [Pseudomonadota bacterium]